jgi:tetratricopeptide (TPR) repeat protein
MTIGDDDLSLDQLSFHEGRLALDAGDYSRAVSCFRRSIGLHEHHKSWELLGESLAVLGDLQGALVAFQRAFTMNDRSCKSGFLLANCMHLLGVSHDEVDTVLLQVLAVNQTYGPALRLRASIQDA